MDLSNINIQDADLSSGLFNYTNFKNANLSHVNF